MKRKILSSTSLFICGLLFCFAVIADLTGKWTGTLVTPDGASLPLTYIFKADGDKLTGSLQTQQGELPISEGKINGSDFSFKMDFNGTPIVNTGKYYVDSIGIDADLNGRKFHTTLKRVTN